MSMPAVRRHRWSRRDYDRMVDAGGFDPEARVELLDGEIWEMTPQGTLHAAVCRSTLKALDHAFGEGYDVRGQFPLALDDRSEPEPDAAVVAGAPFDYLAEHPTSALLVVEVSETSLTHDRGRKLAAYARNGIPEYWLIDLTTRQLEVYRQPSGDRYSSRQVLTRADVVSPLRSPDTAIPVSELLP